MRPLLPSRPGDMQLYKRVLQQVRPYWLHIAGIFLLALLTTPLGLLAPLPMKIAVDSAIGNRPLPAFLDALLPGTVARSALTALAVAVVLMVGIAFMGRLEELASSLLSAYTGERLVLDFRARLFRHAQRLSISYHDRRGTADTAYRILDDASMIQHIPLDGLIPVCSSILTLFSMLYVTARIDWQLALVALAILPLLNRAARLYRRRLRKQWSTVKELESSAFSIIQEVLSALRVVKAFGREDREHERYVERSTEGMRAHMRVALGEGLYSILVNMITTVGTATVLWIGVVHVRAGVLTLGDLLLVMSYLAQLYDPLRTIGKKVGALQYYLVSTERAFAVLDQSPDVIERPNARPLARAKGSVSFRSVSFAYDAGHPVLREVSFDAPAGARVGIAGRTGAGKTTLVSLLSRFYDPASGQILLDGIDLRDYKLADLRNQFALVLQEPVLFSTSIAENIAYARPDASDEEIVRAAQLADAHDFVVRLPQGYETMVGERGMSLSGGERQRISLARAFLKDAPVLLLDEPTSAVDIKTERTIMQAMERLMGGRTSFIIAHRLSTLEGCDLRLEVEHGRIISVSSTASDAEPQALPSATERAFGMSHGL